MSLSKEKLGERVRRLRLESDLSQEEVASHLGVPRQAISQIERGKRDVSAVELKNLSELFSVSPDIVLRDEKKKGERRKTEEVTFQPERLKNLLLYILERCGGKPNIGETVLYKMLYFIDLNSYEKLGRSITGMNYLKLQYGPVPQIDQYRSVVKKMKSEGGLKVFSQKYYDKFQKRYVALEESNKKVFDGEERDIIDKAINQLSEMNAIEIEGYSHGDVPWIASKRGDVINYNLVFDREAPYTDQNYSRMMEETSIGDSWEGLDPLSKEELEYYENL